MFIKEIEHVAPGSLIVLGATAKLLGVHYDVPVIFLSFIKSKNEYITLSYIHGKSVYSKSLYITLDTFEVLSNAENAVEL